MENYLASHGLYPYLYCINKKNMKLENLTTELIGKKVTTVFTGLKVTGVVTNVTENEYAVEVDVKLDRGVNWGGDVYTKSSVFMRKCDGWGSAMHLELI